MDNQLTYQQAFGELQEIVRAMEDGTISVDALAEKVKRASVLISVCKTKLSGTEEEVKAILEGL